MTSRFGAGAFTIAISLIVGRSPIDAQTRDDAKRAARIARAEVWHATDVASMNLKTGPLGEGSFAPGDTIACAYVHKQRIVCLESTAGKGRECAEPLMMINDLGLTFGKADVFNREPRASVNLAEWAPLPIWKDQKGCVGNLSGSLTGTLKDPAISEAGRRFLADLLVRLSDSQLHDMFEAAHVDLRPRVPASGRSGFATIDEWVNAFKQKRTQIVERHCR